MARPLLSVLVDTYNHEKFIEQAIVSVLEQDFPMQDVEILVVDDGSTDGTPEILKGFEPRIRNLRKSNGGQASAFDLGIPECQGDVISFLDGDDWWAPGKLRRVAEFLAAEPAVGIVGHGILEAFEDGTLRCGAPERQERLRLDSFAAARVFRLRKSYLGTSRMTIRSSIARKILPVPESLVFEADEYLFTLAATISDLAILPDPLTYYRQHSANLYNAGGGDLRGLRRKQAVMAALAEALRRELPLRGVPDDAVACVVEIVQADADQLRLMLYGGSPWETVRIEKTIHEVMHGDAPRTYRLFRWVTLVLAGLLPPRWFYGGRQWLASRSWYRSARARVLPVPAITNVAGPEEFKG
jgi:glycosyltransferase involved in cell wall biosynthesis